MSSIVINIDRVSFYHGAELILENLAWEIQAGQKIGLVGPNGAGKSTFLKLIVGELKPDSGIIVRHKTRIGYLAQEPEFKPGSTVWTAVLESNQQLRDIESRMRLLEANMGDPNVYNDEQALSRILSQHAQAQTAFEELGGYRYESRCRQALQTVGFSQSDDTLGVRRPAIG